MYLYIFGFWSGYKPNFYNLPFIALLASIKIVLGDAI